MNNFEELEKFQTEQAGTKKDKRVTEILFEACNQMEFFHSSDKEAYVTIPRNGHHENLPLKSINFKTWLRKQYYDLTKFAIPDKQFKEVLDTLEAKALNEGPEKTVYFRVAHVGDKIYIDLTNETWQVIEVSASGSRILNESPVIFRRAKGMLPLPTPLFGESPGKIIECLKRFLNIETVSDFTLLVGWLISTLGTDGPYLVLVLYGEQGTAKSTTVRVLRNFTDPNITPLRRPPKSTDDLMVMARSNYVVAIDNMSHLTDWMSDDLCVLSTGGGLSKRKLYSDDEEIVLDAKRPIIANGIDEFVARGDLASRSIFLSLPLIHGAQRKSEKELWKEFAIYQPLIFGALLSAVSEGLKNISTLVQSENPRMADAWRFITAAETAFGWPQGTCIDAFNKNQQKANEVVLNSSGLYPFISSYAQELGGFSNTPQFLLNKIKNDATKFNISPSEMRFLPSNPKTLSDKLCRLAPALRLNGIDISFDKSSGSNSRRIIHIKKQGNFCDAYDADQLGDSSDAENLHS